MKIYGTNAAGCHMEGLYFGNPEELGYEEPFPIVCIGIEPLIEKFGENLNHRDYLGALMNLGIERENLGDIFIKGKTGYVFCLERIADFIMENLTQVRHTHVKLRILETMEEFVQKEVEEKAKEMAENYGISVEELTKAYGSIDIVKYDMTMHKALEIIKEGNK